ncbi:ArsR/SmtB family transcription factor [Marinobacterium jannaschii]|uniref:ArsR/SmtB family transcription factor n=1 Tax=Marinobacterium jannaschii TaxID=64970 RepID=UPI00047FBE80|nr:metalloregulator ArsR/SmtB family transcription factor [Marinobacterium jannaschii]
MIERYVDILKALAEPGRLRLYWLLVQIHQRICVAEAMDVLGDTHYNVSRNLKTLQKAGLVSAQKEGKWVFYTLNNENEAFFAQALAAVRTIPTHEFTEEIRRCKLRLSMRDQGRCVVGPGSEAWQAMLESNPTDK